MKLTNTFVAMAALTTAMVCSCGPSAEEIARREQAVADSIAQVERQRELERLARERADSIENAARLREKFVADSIVRAELLPSFVVTENAVGPDISEYRVKGIATGHGRNSAYLSFTTDNGRASDIILNVDYCGSDWLLIEKAIMLVDDDAFDIFPDGSAGDNVGKNLMCSEWFTSTELSAVLPRIAEAKSVTVRIVGKDRNKDLKLSAKELENMKKTIRLYNHF